VNFALPPEFHQYLNSMSFAVALGSKENLRKATSAAQPLPRAQMHIYAQYQYALPFCADVGLALCEHQRSAPSRHMTWSSDVTHSLNTHSPVAPSPPSHHHSTRHAPKPWRWLVAVGHARTHLSIFTRFFLSAARVEPLSLPLYPVPAIVPSILICRIVVLTTIPSPFCAANTLPMYTPFPYSHPFDTLPSSLIYIIILSTVFFFEYNKHFYCKHRFPYPAFDAHIMLGAQTTVCLRVA
jgi:hypothetical protein